MRWLLLLFQWSLLISLLGAVDIGNCNWEMPKSPVRSPGDPIPGTVTTCTQAIKWKAHDPKEALATCLEYFPTTYVTATFSGDTITCTVSQHFQCNFLDKNLNPVPMFDKCYTFHPKDITMDVYTGSTNANHEEYCKKTATGEQGSLPVFYTMTQAKHIAKEAHRKGIFKFWVNANKDGKTIEKSGSNAPGFLLYKDQWKLHKDHYWEGDVLKATTKTDNVPNFPDEAKYLFFRAQTDYWHNLIQGSFERATSTSKAGIVCEYQAKVVPDQQNYCAKMGARGLGLNAIYDETKGRRCIYTTLSRYPLMGTADAIKNFKGCGEKPSDENSAGMDDGTASASTYTTLTADGTYRVAAIRADLNPQHKTYARQYCDKTDYSNQPETVRKQRQPYETYDHFFKKDYAVRMMGERPQWEDKYPKDECTDFSGSDMHSNTLAIRKGKIIDVPTPVLLPVVCSIASNVDCKLKKNENKCDNKEGLFCKDVMEWQPDTQIYGRCECPEWHKWENNVCKWQRDSQFCARTYSAQFDRWGDITTYDYSNYNDGYNNVESKIVVRNGCTLTIWSYKMDVPKDKNVVLLGPVPVGEYDIPNDKAGTLKGWEGEMGASAIGCNCHNPK